MNSINNFENILSIYNSFIDSTAEIKFDSMHMTINVVKYTEYIVENSYKKIILIGDQSPDEYGHIRKKSITIEHIDDKVIFKFENDYDGSFFMSNNDSLYLFKVYKSSNKGYYSIY